MLSTLTITFVTIAETGSITKAADSLGLAKSAVSQNLKRLEEQLNVKLATRTTRQFSLTPAGERYYKRCKEILVLANQAGTEMEDFGAVPAGPITITAPHALIAPVLTPAIAEVVTRYPKLRPSLIADDNRLDLIAKGIDVAISVGNLPDSNFKAQRVGTLQDTLCASPSLLADKPKNEADYRHWLQSLPYIAHSREGTTVRYTLFSEQNKKNIQLQFKARLTSNTIESLISLTRAGLGIAQLPSLAIANDLKSGNLVKLLPSYSLTPAPVYAVHVYDTLPPQSVMEIIRAVKIAFANF